MLATGISSEQRLALLQAAGKWFLNSGIQEPSGGVARYYLCDSRRNMRVSTEITGYALSFLSWLHEQTGDSAYLNGAMRAARYLCREAWDSNHSTFPFEPASASEPGFAYFFDCGIIVRGLLALYRATGDGELLQKAQEAAVAMAFDFHAQEAVYPIISLPDKQPVPYQSRWSRSPGCYQLKSALAWLDVAQTTGQMEIAAAYERMLTWSLSTHDEFLPGEENPEKVMDRLHAYCYFLEGLLPVASRPECRVALASGIQRTASYLRAIAPAFARSDVYAQLLRVRLYAHDLGAVPLDFDAAAHEAQMAASFQNANPDPALAGGFWFGRRGGKVLPFMNPVSTAFCAQALSFWMQLEEGAFHAPVTALV